LRGELLLSNVGRKFSFFFLLVVLYWVGNSSCVVCYKSSIVKQSKLTPLLLAGNNNKKPLMRHISSLDYKTTYPLFYFSLNRHEQQKTHVSRFVFAHSSLVDNSPYLPPDLTLDPQSFPLLFLPSVPFVSVLPPPSLLLDTMAWIASLPKLERKFGHYLNQIEQLPPRPRTVSPSNRKHVLCHFPFLGQLPVEITLSLMRTIHGNPGIVCLYTCLGTVQSCCILCLESPCCA
jgi:hypothetical protein